MLLDYNQTQFKGIIPFSGGIDSTAGLYHTLTEKPKENYLVFHIDLINGTSGNRYILEKKAVSNIITVLQKKEISNFAFKQLSFDYSVFDIPLVWDSEVINFVAAMQVRAHPEMDVFIEGAIKDDYEVDGFKERLEKIEKIFYLVSERTKDNFEILFPIKHLSKYEVMKSIPKDILGLTWSCRYPEIGTPYTFMRCHKCPPCKILDKVIQVYPNDFKDIDILK